MRKLGAFCLFILLSLALGVALIWLFALQPEPSAPPSAAGATRDQLQAVHELLRQQTRLIDSHSGAILLSPSELGELLALAVSRLPVPAGGRVRLEQGVARITLSLQAPVGSRWLNLDLAVAEDLNETARLARLDVGAIRVPDVLLPAIVAEARRKLGQQPEGRAVEQALQSLERLQITPAAVEAQFALTPALQRELVEQQGDLLFGPTVRARAQHFVATLQAWPRLRHGETLPLDAALRHLAGAVDRDADMIAEQRALLLALALHSVPSRLLAIVGGDDRLLGNVRQRPRFILQRRHDLAQHFIISALLASYGDEQLASRVGLYKELNDQQTRSGFDPTDLVADYAGIAFGQLGTQRPQWLINRLVTIDEADLLPPVSQLGTEAREDLLTLAAGSDLEQIEAGVERHILPLLLQAPLYAEAVGAPGSD